MVDCGFSHWAFGTWGRPWECRLAALILFNLENREGMGELALMRQNSPRSSNSFTQLDPFHVVGAFLAHSGILGGIPAR
jgi:hypothetical protein